MHTWVSHLCMHKWVEAHVHMRCPSAATVDNHMCLTGQDMMKMGMKRNMMTLVMSLMMSLMMSFISNVISDVIGNVILCHCWGHMMSLLTWLCVVFMCEFSTVVSGTYSHTLDNTVWTQFLVTCDCVTTSNGFSKYRSINLGKMMTNRRNIWNTRRRNKNCENVNYWAVIQQLSFCNKVTE